MSLQGVKYSGYLVSAAESYLVDMFINKEVFGVTDAEPLIEAAMYIVSSAPYGGYPPLKQIFMGEIDGETDDQTEEEDG